MDAQEPPPRKVTVTRVAASRSRELTGSLVRRVQAASRADGAAESGLTQLLWVNALHMAGDAMIAVSLAGTLFFAAPTHAQRGNVALYLLVTMAPFAVLAPIIGPALDKLQHGRRWAIAGSQLGRALLCVVMAAHFHDFWLYPAALGTLVLSKALNVLKAAVIPRVLPPGLPLTSANSRLSVFGLITAGIAGALGAGVAKAVSFQAELWVTAAVFVVGTVLSVKLPRHVDVAEGEEPADVFRTGPVEQVGRRRRRVSPHVTTALRANGALRFLGGFLTIFSAFLVEATVPNGWKATLTLGAIAAAAGVGSILGTAVGSRLRSVTPERLVLVSAGVAAGVTVVAAIFFGLEMAALVAGVSAVTNALGKVALDALIQRDVPESLRASAFARSETVLQLAWVVGGGLDIAIASRPPSVTPELQVLVSAGVAAGVTVVAAIFFGLEMAALVAGVSAVTNALGKVALDALIQRDVPESLRASAFARSETVLQLAWVVGGGLGIALPPIGWIGFTVAAGLLVLAFGLVLWGRPRGTGRPAREAAGPTEPAPGPDSPTTPLGPSWS